MDTYQLVSSGCALQSDDAKYTDINILEEGATLFIGFGGSCYHFSPDCCFHSVSDSLCLTHSLPLSLFVGTPRPVSGPSSSFMKLHEFSKWVPTFICPYLPKLVHVCACGCAYVCVQLATCCDVFTHIRGLFKCLVPLYSQVVFDLENWQCPRSFCECQICCSQGTVLLSRIMKQPHMLQGK